MQTYHVFQCIHISRIHRRCTDLRQISLHTAVHRSEASVGSVGIEEWGGSGTFQNLPEQREAVRLLVEPTNDVYVCGRRLHQLNFSAGVHGDKSRHHCEGEYADYDFP